MVSTPGTEASSAAAAPQRVALVIHQPDCAAFDETMSTEETVGDLLERVRQRLGVVPGARIRLICAGAVLQESSLIGKAVRARPDVGIYHVHCAISAPPPPQPPPPQLADAYEGDMLLPGHQPMLDPGEVVSLSARRGQADFVWGFLSLIHI